MKAYRKAIDVLVNNTAMRVDLMIDFADWMYANGQPVSDAEDLLVSTLDILLETDAESVVTTWTVNHSPHLSSLGSQSFASLFGVCYALQDVREQC